MCPTMGVTQQTLDRAKKTRPFERQILLLQCILLINNVYKNQKYHSYNLTVNNPNILH